MRKIFAFIFLFSTWISHAQNTLNNVGLTNIAPASVAYSVRQLSTTYTGPLIRIQVGASFYDVYPDASTKFFSLNSKISAPISTYNAAIGAASANALSTIITASTNATVAIWYDQSGNNVHVLSSNGSAKVITSGSINMMNGQPTIRFFGSGSTSFLTSTNTVNYSSQNLATVNAVAQNLASSDLVSGIIATGDSGGWGLNYDPTTSVKGYWIDGSGEFGAASNENSTDAKIVTGFMGTTISSSIYSNSVLKGTKNSHTIANGVADKIYVGIRGNYSTTRQFDGNISETILFPKNLTSAEQAALESSQSIFLPVGVNITSSATGAVCSGTSVTFTANTTGIISPSYQWYKNSVAINGATSSSYTTSTLSNNDVIYVTAAEGAATVSSSGLVLNLDAGNASSYTSGSTWTDLSGGGNHGTLNNVTYSASNQGYFSFNGTTSNVSLPNSTDFNFGTGDFTIELWLEKTSGTTTPNFLAINSNNGFYSSIRIGWSPNINGNPTLTFAHSTNGTSWNIQTGVTSSLSTWSQIVLSRSAGVVTVYVNGVNKGSYNLSGALMTTTTSTPIYNQIGSLPNWPSVYTLLGKMSIIRYYKTAGLTSAQVVSNYNAICSRYSLNPIGINSNSITTTITAGPSAPLTILGDGCINKTSLSSTSGQTSYTWYKDNVAISGATSNTYAPTSNGDYKVQISNGTCASMSTSTTISTCGVNADGSMIIVENSTTLVDRNGTINSGKGVDQRGLIVSKPFYAPAIITNGLVLYLDAGNSASYPGTGTTWTDLSSSANVGTFVGGTSYSSSDGGTILFNGNSLSNDYVSVANNASLNLTTAGSISMWIKPNSLTQLGLTNLISRTIDGAPNGQSYYIYWTGGNITGIIQNGGVYKSISTPVPTAIGWYNYVFTWGNGYLNLYQNGVSVATPIASSIIAQTLSTTVNIGGYVFGGAGGNANTFNGKIPFVTLYNREITPAEVLTNFNAVKTRYGL